MNTYFKPKLVAFSIIALRVVGLGVIPNAGATTSVVQWGAVSASVPASATNVIQVAGGDSHSLALRADGTVIGWGDNSYGQITVPPDITNAVRIAAGSTHSVALLEDGTIRFWGSIYSTGVTNPPVGFTANMCLPAVGPTAQHVLSIRSDGRAVDWGNSSFGVTNVPASVTNAVDAAVASYHAIAVRDDGKPVSWGQYYPLGPVAPVPTNATNVVAVAAGFSHDLALRADGTILGWGSSSLDATNPPEATNITAIASGSNQRLALRADGTVLSWNQGAQSTGVPASATHVVGIAAMTSAQLAIVSSDGPPLVGRILHPSFAVASPARFRVFAVSTTPLSYQWMFAGTNISGGTNATLSMPNIQLEQAGIYTVIVSNVFGSVTNSNVQVAVSPVLFQNYPTNQTVSGGSSPKLTGSAIGQATISYRWMFSGTNLTANPTNSVTVTNIQPSQGGPYSLIASNTNGTATASASLTVVPLFITSQPKSGFTNLGGGALFSVSVSGQGPFTYQWQFLGTNLSNATNSQLALTNCQFSQAGGYSVIVSNLYGAVPSSNAFLSVVPILVSSQPIGDIAFRGKTETLGISAQANPSPTYQWHFNGLDVPGATLSTLTISNCDYTNSGVYSVTVSSGPYSTNSLEVTISVVPIAAWGRSIEAETSVPTNLFNVLSVSAGGLHSIALKADGTVRAWGPVPQPPNSATGLVATAVGDIHAVGLRSDGSVVTWGVGIGTNNMPGDLTNVVAVGAASQDSLALRSDGTVVEWGSNGNGQTNVPVDLTNAISVDCGGGHSLALRADGTLVHWGFDAAGSLNVPVGLTNIVAIAAGTYHCMALRADGTVAVWGDSQGGVKNIPEDATNLVAISAGTSHCLGLRADGIVFAWGINTYGEAIVPPALKNVIAIADGAYHSLALVADSTPRRQAMMTGLSWSGGSFSVSVPTVSGKVYLLEYKNSLEDAAWTGLPLVAGTGKARTLVDNTSNGIRRYYRVREW